MAKKKVAIVLSGGVSLGAYIAGALDELMQAFSSTDAYEIDIITGASAGATTAAIIAHGLLYKGGQTSLYDVWVKKVDIVDMLAGDLAQGDTVSLLTSRPLRELAQDTLRWGDPKKKPRRASFCSDELTLVMTLANTTPLPYIAEVRQPTANGAEEFMQRRHSEQETFTLTDMVGPTDARWGRITEVALASSAIPLVFPLVPLERESGKKEQYVQKPNFDGTGHFWYYDGGTFNNLPIDVAWYHMDRRKEPGEGPLENRRVVVVNPWRSGDTVSNLAPKQPSVTEQALGLLAAIKLESGAIQFDRGVTLPSHAASGATAGASGLMRAIPGIPRAPVDLLDEFALVMPAVDAPPLRGIYLHSLAAFLDERFREYDFRRGASDARDLIKSRLGIDYTPQRAPDFYEPDKDASLQPDIAEYDVLDRIPSARFPGRMVREVFEQALDWRIDSIIRALDLPGPDLFVDPVVAHILKTFARSHLPELWKQTNS